MKTLASSLVAAGALLVAGCGAPRTLYSWGSYESLVYTMYARPDQAPPELQVTRMEEDFQKARAKNKPMPPGWHAHLGYLYFELGQADQARQQFETEKTNFPESAVFMDRLLANLNKP